MDAEGISKFWKMKVMTNRPMARTVQMEAKDSSGVSVQSCSAVSISFAAVATVSVKSVSSDAAISVSLMRAGFERDLTESRTGVVLLRFSHRKRGLRRWWTLPAAKKMGTIP
jgi:hypothetical protein